MNNNLDHYKSFSKEAGILPGKLTDEYMFTLHIANLFLFEKNIGATDIEDGFVDGCSDGGIDFIYPNDDTLTLIQGKSSTKTTKDDIINAINKIIKTVDDFNSNNEDRFNRKLISKFLNAKDSLSDDATIRIIIATNKEFDEKAKAVLHDILKNDQNYLDYECVLYDKSDIDEKLEQLESGIEAVKFDKIKLSEANNFLKYKENGYVVNIKASSLKRLFQKHTSGLFSYNLREYIVNKSVDSGIIKTIQKDKENFWFYNNGITIACADCVIDGNVCKLYEFSIINNSDHS